MKFPRAPDHCEILYAAPAGLASQLLFFLVIVLVLLLVIAIVGRFCETPSTPASDTDALQCRPIEQENDYHWQCGRAGKD
jgi:hypothetical protein